MDNYYSYKDETEFISDVQRMLRGLSVWLSQPRLSVALDGNLDEGTKSAVAFFQEERDLPVTGNIDFETWEALMEEYEFFEELNTSPRPISPMLKAPDYRVKNGERGTLVFIVQLMLNELLKYYDSYGYIPPNGRYTDATEQAVREFQRLNGLPQTGEIDRRTWNRLATQFDLTVTSE